MKSVTYLKLLAPFLSTDGKFVYLLLFICFQVFQLFLNMFTANLLLVRNRTVRYQKTLLRNLRVGNALQKLTKWANYCLNA